MKKKKKKSLRGSKGDAVDVFWVVTLCRLANTDHRPEDNRRRLVGVSGAVRGLMDIGTAIGLLLVGATDCRRPKHEAFRVACNQGSRCGNTLRTDSGNLTFFSKSCACTSIAFLAGIMSWSLDRSKCFHGSSKRVVNGFEGFHWYRM